MNLYAIYLFEGGIALYEFMDGRSSPIKNMGELKQIFEYEGFWTWWKTKVEYQASDEYAFIIFTDQKEFLIPQDIRIAEKIDIQPLKVLLTLTTQLPKGANSFTQPASLLSELTIPRDASSKKLTKAPLANGSLEDYFVKETLRFKAEV